MTTFGSTTEDQDGVPKDYDRGPPSEDRKTEAELRGQMRDIASAKATIGEKATIQGLIEEVAVLKGLFDELSTQHTTLINSYGTLRGELDQFRQQWNIERASWLANGGSTTPEDVNGSEFKSSN